MDKGVERQHIEIESIEYDLSTIYLMQDEMHERYDKMTREIGFKVGSRNRLYFFEQMPSAIPSL